jgi:hypothetical protein
MTHDVRVDARSNCTGKEVNDWLRANAKRHFTMSLMAVVEGRGLVDTPRAWDHEVWVDCLGVMHESNDAHLIYRFEDASDALRFKLTFGVANVSA